MEKKVGFWRVNLGNSWNFIVRGREQNKGREEAGQKN